MSPRALPGPDPRPDSPALAEALRALSLPKRPPTEADARPASRLPMTKAQREALRLSKGKL
jgi:hypothetical protein